MRASRRRSTQDSQENGWFTREHVLILVLIVFTLLAFVLCVLIAQPFIGVLAWALALAIIARPLHDVISKRIKNRDLAAGASVALVALIILTPLLFVVGQLVSEVKTGVEKIQGESGQPTQLEEIEHTPWVGEAVTWLRENVDIQGAVQQAIGPVSGILSQALAGSIWAVVQLLLVLFTLYFLFRDRDKAMLGLRSLMPLSEAETDNVFGRVADTIHATIYGSLLVAFIQGALGGLMFWFLGLPSPVIWGVVMALLAVIPNLGSFVVWMPAAAILALSGDHVRAAILVGWGAIAIGLIDNLLYPFLVGNRMRLHTLLVFFAILGGVMLLGAAGIVLGPVILVVTIALVDVWRRRTKGGQAAEEKDVEESELVANGRA